MMFRHGIVIVVVGVVAVRRICNGGLTTNISVVKVVTTTVGRMTSSVEEP